MDGTVDADAREGFPWTHFVPSGHGVALDHSPQHVVMLAETYRQRRPADHCAYHYYQRQ